MATPGGSIARRRSRTAAESSTGAQPQIDPAHEADPIERVLRAGDVHHSRAAAALRRRVCPPRAARRREAPPARSRVSPASDTERGSCRATGTSHRVAACRVDRLLRHKSGWIVPARNTSIPSTAAARAALDANVHFDGRARHRDLRIAGHRAIDRLVESAAGSAHARGRHRRTTSGTPCASSSTADSLTSCTAYPSATPSAIASTAISVRVRFCASDAARAPRGRRNRIRNPRPSGGWRAVRRASARGRDPRVAPRPCECVTRRPAAPRAFTWSRSSRSTAPHCPGSRLPVGSSASTSSGPWTSARAIATRCNSPPESSRGMLASRSVSPTAAEHSPRASRLRRGSDADQRQRERDVLPHRQVRQHVKGLEDEAHLLAPQRGQRVVVECARDRRRQRIEPASGRSSPATRLSSVDLPIPDSPIIATYSPARTSRSTLREADALARNRVALLRGAHGHIRCQIRLALC